MRDDQSFAWGPELKAELARLNEELLRLPNSEREKGLLRILERPPKEGFITRLWEKSFEKDYSERVMTEASTENSSTVDYLRFIKAPALENHEINFDVADPSLVAIARSIHIRKGSHWQLPKGTKGRD